MSATTMDKDRLAAFVDGELTPDEAAAVAMHLADHPVDQAYVDDLFAANAALARAFAAPLHEPVPPAIRDAILGKAETARPTGGTVVAFRPRRAMAAAGLLLAASVAAAALWLPGLAPAPGGVGLGPLAAADPLAGVLDRSVSGAVSALSDGREAMVLASFAMSDGRFCREFEVIDQAAARIDLGIVCRSGSVWTVEATIAEAIAGSDAGFVAAEGGEADTLTRFLERHGETVPLDAAAEAEAIARRWAP